MKTHQMECVVDSCVHEALPRVDVCRLHYLRGWLKDNNKKVREGELDVEDYDSRDDEID